MCLKSLSSTSKLEVSVGLLTSGTNGAFTVKKQKKNKFNNDPVCQSVFNHSHSSYSNLCGRSFEIRQRGNNFYEFLSFIQVLWMLFHKFAWMHCILMELTVSDFVPLDPLEPRMIDEVLKPVFTKPSVCSTDQSLQ